MQAVDVELVGTDTYRISRLLRGQYGTDHVLVDTVLPGARVVYLGQGWQDIPLNADLRGTAVDFTLAASGREGTESFAIDYAANHLRPLAPVHIRAERTGDTIEISWIRRTRNGGDDWTPQDVPLGEESERYRVEFRDGSTTVLVRETSSPTLQIPAAELETAYGMPLDNITVSVAQISQIYVRGSERIMVANI